MNYINGSFEIEITPLPLALYGSPYGFSEQVSVPILPNVDLCFYCGNLLKTSADQCPGCGARDWRRKRHG